MSTTQLRYLERMKNNIFHLMQQLPNMFKKAYFFIKMQIAAVHLDEPTCKHVLYMAGKFKQNLA